MKSALILSTIVLAVLSATSAAPANPASQWCAAFSTGCKNAALSVCGGNNSSQSKCDSEFQGTTCKTVSVSCNCTPTGGSVRGAVNAALQNTFALTGGACSNLDFSNPEPPAPEPTTTSTTTTVNPSTLLPPTPTTTDGAVPPPTGVPTPNPTSVSAPPSSAVAVPSAPAPGATSNPPKSGAVRTKSGAVAAIAALAGVAMTVL
ncbi:hypothetical protein BGZ74_000057 [Mortierella antarctica]|nr:hypothetical protein BGZ74_000057 [Mortierella antarctica]